MNVQNPHWPQWKQAHRVKQIQRAYNLSARSCQPRFLSTGLMSMSGPIQINGIPCASEDLQDWNLWCTNQTKDGLSHGQRVWPARQTFLGTVVLVHQSLCTLRKSTVANDPILWVRCYPNVTGWTGRFSPTCASFSTSQVMGLDVVQWLIQVTRHHMMVSQTGDFL